MARPQRFRALSLMLAIILLATAALKLHLLLTDPFADIKTGNPIAILWLAVILETAVAWLIFTAVSDELKWLVLFAFFSALTAFSIFNVASGKSDCGCAGVITFSPRGIVLLDLGVLTSLVSTRPTNLMAITLQTRFADISGATWGIALGGMSAVAAFLAYQADSVPEPIASWLGRPALPNIRINLGPRTGLGAFDHSILLTNPTDRDIRIVGVEQSCTCVVLERAALSSIPRRGTKKISVVLHPTKTGPFHQRVLFHLNSPQQHSVAVDFIALITE